MQSSFHYICHCPLQPFSQSHLSSSRQVWDASGSVVHFASQPPLIFAATPNHPDMVVWEQLRTSVPKHDLPGRQLSLYVPQVQLESVEGHPLVYLSVRTAASVPHSPSPHCSHGRTEELESTPVHRAEHQQSWELMLRCRRLGRRHRLSSKCPTPSFFCGQQRMILCHIC